MRCEEIRSAWLQARYAQSAQSAEVAAHVATCGECGAFVTAQLGLDGVLQARDVASPGPGFDTRFFARLAAERPARARRFGTRAWLFAPILAAAAAALVFAVWPKRHPHGAAEEDIAIAKDLELVEALPVLEHLDEVEAYETLAHIDADELERIGRSAP